MARPWAFEAQRYLRSRRPSSPPPGDASVCSATAPAALHHGIVMVIVPDVTSWTSPTDDGTGM